MSEIATWREIVVAYDSIHLLHTTLIVCSNEIFHTLNLVIQELRDTALSVTQSIADVDIVKSQFECTIAYISLKVIDLTLPKTAIETNMVTTEQLLWTHHSCHGNQWTSQTQRYVINKFTMCTHPFYFPCTQHHYAHLCILVAMSRVLDSFSHLFTSVRTVSCMNVEYVMNMVLLELFSQVTPALLH